MSLDLIDNLAGAAAELRAAMRAADLEEIGAANTRFQNALHAVQAVGAWRADSQLKARIAELIEELDASRRLACRLSDLSGQMHMAIASRNPDVPQPLYQPAR